MATVNHVRRINIPLPTNQFSAGFRGFWELTRAIKKAGWKYKASSNGSSKETTGNPATDLWAVASAASNAGAAAASIAAPTRGRANVSGLIGITAADKGRFLLISGGATSANNNQHQIEEIISPTEVRIDARQFAVASDANNGALTWSIRDPLLEPFTSYLGSGSVGWWVGQGPSVLKIPINTASAGTFIRGENLVQASTGAEGELLGYTYYNGVGWLVVAPRLRGTGAGAWGWDTANVITGGTSAATVTQVGAAIDYVYEVCIIKPANNTTIQVFFVQADKAVESAELFSFCATQAGCTATVHPGGGGTGNAFGAHAWVAWGVGTTAGAGSFIYPIQFPGSQFPINACVICVDAIPEQGYSADGSWGLVALFGTSGVIYSSAVMWAFQRLVDTEDGDLSPYISVFPAGQKTNGGNSRTSAGTIPPTGSPIDHLSFEVQNSYLPAQNYNGMYAGWRARGLAAESFAEFNAAAQILVQTDMLVQTAVYGVQRMQASAHPAVKIREKLWMTYASNRGYKGSFRWLFWVLAGFPGDAFGGDPGWLQLTRGGAVGGISDTSSLGGSLVLGPHDGTQFFTWSAGGL